MKIETNSVFPQEFCFSIVQYIPGMNPMCKCKASKTQTLYTWHLSYKNDSKVTRSLGCVAVAGSGGDRGALTFCGGDFLNSQILKAKGGTGLQGNLSCLAKERCIPTTDNFKTLQSPTQICS
jgi:hypothetical protein